MKVCLDCPRLIPEGNRCPDCARATTAAKATRTWKPGERAAHRRLRTAYQRRMNTGETFTCWRCGQPIDPASWHLGHDDNDRTIHRGPEHPTCNTSAAGTKPATRT